MDVEGFAQQYRLRTKRDECGETIIPGRLGQIYEHGPDGFGVMFMPPAAARARLWGNTRRKLVAAGFQLLQNGDAEGSLLFNPNDSDQARLAIPAVRIKSRRVASPAQLAALGRAREAIKTVRTTGQRAVERPNFNR